MSTEKPTSRTEATKPEATSHLDDGQKRALDTSAEIEHTDGKKREDLTERAEDQAEGREGEPA